MNESSSISSSDNQPTYPKILLTSLLQTLLHKRLSTLEQKTHSELQSIEYTKQNINSTMSLISTCTKFISSSKPKKTKKLPSHKSNPKRPLTPLTDHSRLLTQMEVGYLSQTISKPKKLPSIIPPAMTTFNTNFYDNNNQPHRPIHISKTPVVSNTSRKKRKVIHTNISGIICNVSNVNDELITSISTDIYTRNSILPKYVMFSFSSLFESNTTFINYLPLDDVLSFMLINKCNGIYFIDELICRLERSKRVIDKEIKHKEKDNKIFKPFDKGMPLILSQKAKKALELLNDREYSKIFTQKAAGNSNNDIKNSAMNRIKTPSDNVIAVYQILFQLFNPKKCDVMLYIGNNAIFWHKLSKYITSNSKGKLGLYLQREIYQIDFSKHDNIQKVIAMIKDNLHIFTMNYFHKICSTTSLVVFALKEVLMHIGVDIQMIEKMQQLLMKQNVIKVLLNDYLKIKESVYIK